MFYSALRWCLGLCLSAAPGLAYDVTRYQAMLDDCIAYQRSVGPEAVESCNGIVTSLCIDTEADGMTTAGMANCAWMERDIWDVHLNAEYQRARAMARQLDADYGLTPSIVDSLRDAQRAWIAFRDAECTLSEATAMGGTIGRQFASGCHSGITARRTIDLMMLIDQLN